MTAIPEPSGRRGSVGRSVQAEGDAQGAVESFEFDRRECSNEMGERGLRDTDKLIAMYTAIVFQALVHTNRNLSCKAIEAGIDWRTDSRGEARIEQCLATHHDKDSVGPRILHRGFVDSVQLAPSHTST